MIYLRQILRCGRNYHLAIPVAWCLEYQVRPGSAVLLQASCFGSLTSFFARAVRCGRGLHVTLPRPFRQAEGLTWGDPLILLEGEPGILCLRVIEGISEKELARLGQVVALMRIAQARRESDERRQAAYRQGWFHGACYAFGDHLRRAVCFNRAHGPLEPSPPLPAPCACALCGSVLVRIIT